MWGPRWCAGVGPAGHYHRQLLTRLQELRGLEWEVLHSTGSLQCPRVLEKRGLGFPRQVPRAGQGGNSSPSPGQALPWAGLLTRAHATRSPGGAGSCGQGCGHLPPPCALQVNQGNMPGIQSTFLAMDTEEGVEVVWNELLFTDKKAFKAHEEKIKTMFEQLVLVDHPNIVKLHKYWLDVKDSKARVIFITEYVSSGSLKQFLKKTKKNHKAMNARVGSLGAHTACPRGSG
uniref:Serine-threonine/tyrosine-protein kinase catalytic domain-containing protein n=1 Tax=Strigops habroptila TaxID=2489341 RepID=A0A672TI05_STRHB